MHEEVRLRTHIVFCRSHCLQHCTRAPDAPQVVQSWAICKRDMRSQSTLLLGMLARFNTGASLPCPALISSKSPSNFHAPHHRPCSQHQPVVFAELEGRGRRHCPALRDARRVSAVGFPFSRLMVNAGDPIIRSDEELALSVLRYGKILSRKLENRMQVPSPSPTPRLPHSQRRRMPCQPPTVPLADQRSAHGAHRAAADDAASSILPHGKRGQQVPSLISHTSRGHLLFTQRGSEYLLREGQRAHGSLPASCALPSACDCVTCDV